VKKLFVVLIAFVLVFMACKEETADDNSDVIGVWMNGTVTLDIADGTWVMVNSGGPNTYTYNGTWTRDANTLKFATKDNSNFATASLSEGKLFLKWGSPIVTFTRKTDTPPSTTKLIIKNESSVEIADAIWQGVSFAPSQTNTTITSGSLVTKTVQPGSGYIFFTRKTNPINARTNDFVVIEKDKQKEFVFTDNTLIVDINNPDNIGTLGTLQPLLTTLKIKNESFVEITDVIWQGVSFANDQYENSIKSGTTVTKTVQPGGGYIFFKRKANPIIARTNDIVIIEKNDGIEFIFTDNTPIVEVNNPDNNGTLGALQSTVVWWDDAEGEMQPYYMRQNFAGYYGSAGDLPTSNQIFYLPKNGRKAIAVGGYATSSLLHIKITLTNKAKLSFWYAGRACTFLINNETKFTPNGNIAWSFNEFELESGLTDLIWEFFSVNNGYYFFLDDILIYYTE
jgi:uncharacterized lipoprotein NlpE involved in copper resistance